MQNLTVNYTGEPVALSGLVTTPEEAADAIIKGDIPANLLDVSFHNRHFRDATIAYILKNTIHALQYEIVLETLAQALRGTDDNETEKILMFTEYLSAISYAWDRPQVSITAISRLKPELASNYIWQVCQAMNKQMPGPFYQTLLINQLSVAETMLNAGSNQNPTV